MIGGNIPGVTKVLSVTLYDHVEALDYGRRTCWRAACWCSPSWCCSPSMAARGCRAPSDERPAGALPHARGEFALDAELSVPARGVTALFGASGCGKDHPAALHRRARARIRGVSSRSTARPGRTKRKGGSCLPMSAPVATCSRKRACSRTFRFAATSSTDYRRVPGEPAQGRVRRHRRDAGPLAAARPATGRALRRRAPARGHRARGAVEPAPAAHGRADRRRSTPRARARCSTTSSACATSSRIPIFYVSHAIDEVVRLADTMAVMSDGKVVACGGVTELASRLDLRPVPRPLRGRNGASRPLWRRTTWRMGSLRCASTAASCTPRM